MLIRASSRESHHFLTSRCSSSVMNSLRFEMSLNREVLVINMRKSIINHLMIVVISLDISLMIWVSSIIIVWNFSARLRFQIWSYWCLSSSSIDWFFLHFFSSVESCRAAKICEVMKMTILTLSSLKVSKKLCIELLWEARLKRMSNTRRQSWARECTSTTSSWYT